MLRPVVVACHISEHMVLISAAFVAKRMPRAQGALRIVTGFLFLQHATAKLFGVPHVAYFDNLTLFSLMGVAGIIELVGAPFLLLGLFTRPIAFVLSGEMATA